MNIIKMMTPKVNTVFLHDSNTVRQGMEVMLHYGYTVIPVLDEEDRYLGCITEGDFLKLVLEVGSTDMKVFEGYHIGQILRPDYCAPLDIAASEEDVVNVTLKQNFIPIVDARRCLCGIVPRQAVVRYLADK